MERTTRNKFLRNELLLRLERNIMQKELDELIHFITLGITNTLNKDRLEKCSTFVEVWEELEHQNIIGPGKYGILLKALKERRDLVRAIEDYEDYEGNIKESTPTKSSSHGSAMALKGGVWDLCRHLQSKMTKKESDELIHFIRLRSINTLNKDRLEECSTLVEVWEELEHQNIIRPGDYELLKKALEAIGRPDLVVVIEEHELILKAGIWPWANTSFREELAKEDGERTPIFKLFAKLSGLHSAIKGGHIDWARVLMDRGADINIKDVQGDSPLILAIMGRHIDLAKKLIDRGADINIKDGQGHSPLCLAIMGRHIDLAKELIDRDADINIKDIRNDSILHFVIKRDHIDLARELIDRGADINIKDWRNDSPLHLVIKGGHIDLARELIARGADINIKDGRNDSPLHLVIKGDHIGLARELIDRGADINIKDGRNDSPLHLVIKGDHIGLARELIDRGADINIKDGRNDSPLHLVIKGDHIGLARELIDRGADINIKDGRNDSPLHLVIKGGHIDLARELIARGADINIKDGQNDSPSHLVIKGGHIDLARELIARGADINIKDGQGESPFRLAIKGRHINLAKKLSDSGADFDIKDDRDHSPLHLAIAGSHIDLAKELIDRGADIDINDGQGDSPLCLKDDMGTNHDQRQDEQPVKSYRMTFSLDQPFKEDLKDEESEAYKKLEQEILDKLLRKAFGDDFKKISVLKFEEGSIKVNLVIELTGDEDIEELKEKLQKVEEEANKMMQFKKSTLIFEVLKVNSDDTSEDTQEPAIGNIHGMHFEGDLTVHQDITINNPIRKDKADASVTSCLHANTNGKTHVVPLEHHWKICSMIGMDLWNSRCLFKVLLIITTCVFVPFIGYVIVQ